MTTTSWKLKPICAALALLLTPTFTYAQDKATATAAPTASTTTAPVGTAGEADAATTATVDATATGDAADTDAATDATGAEATGESAAVPIDGVTYRVRLRDLEQRVDELKEQIRRSHTRLSLLSDTILAGGSGGARAEIEFVNDLSGAWHVVEAIFVMDGAVQYKKTDDTGILAEQKTIPIFSGSVPTGDHTLQVMLKLRGHGFGVFSYLRGIEASLKADHSFTLTEGKVLELRATAWEQGGPTTPVEEQPDIRFNQSIRNAGDAPQPMPAKAAAPKADADASGSAGDGKLGGAVGGSSTTGTK
jgi:hypothetical protein